MSSADGDLPEGSLRHRPVAHYHGDTVRSLFVVTAIVMIIAETTGASLPLSTIGIVSLVVVLVVVAGITNPAQAWIHFINAALAIFGAIAFGLYAIQQYHLVQSLFSPTYLFSEALALIFLAAVYYATKTVRGVMLRPRFK
jgi:uncharacterized membrane protein YuzA (DUF378 family)